MKLDNITVNIPTLNEQNNIAACIKAVKRAGIKNILVIDGGSEDETLKILKNLKRIKILRTKKKGLANQRRVGVNNSKTKYIALIDADMRPKKDCFVKMLRDLDNSEFAGVEAEIKPDKTINYFDKSYQDIMDVHINIKGPRRMIGTPTLWHANILKKNNFDPFFTGPSDDTDLCYRIHKKGHIFGGSTGQVLHVHRSNLKDFYKKYTWYGKGDAQFILKHPERLISIIKHQIYNYPIKISCRMILKGKFIAIPFPVCAGFLRFCGMIIFLLSRLIRKKEQIYNT